jgi:hypothetical protein
MTCWGVGGPLELLVDAAQGKAELDK